MSDKSKIEWTDASWNPIRGCSRVSEGCKHCYAEGIAARFSGPGEAYAGLAHRVKWPDGSSEARWTNEVVFAGDKVLQQPLRWTAPRKIFVNSMSDLFHENVADEVIDRVFAVMALCPQHTFQILTKRPERMRDYLTGWGAFERMFDQMCGPTFAGYPSARETAEAHGIPFVQPTCAQDWWPLRNVWLGVSVENQATAEERIPLLLQTPAEVRFISAEPLLGPIDLSDMCDGWKFYNPLTGARWTDPPADEPGYSDMLGGRLDWVIVGGESGSGARPMNPVWARSLRDQCGEAGVPFFFKQWGEWLGGRFHLDLEDFLRFEDLAETRFYPLNGKTPEHFWEDDKTPEGLGSLRIGKAKAGRALDGVEHDGFPS